jgi:uncharacterized protein
MGSAALAFSGGVDSSLLAYLGARELGDKFVAVTLRSVLMSEKDLAECVQFCKDFDIQHVFLDMDILGNSDFAANCSQRCYFCKDAIFSVIQGYACEKRLAFVMDGTIAEDCPDRRPGMRVLDERKIQSPLRSCGLGKTDIRELSKELRLWTWDKESDSCLATRIPHGQAITLDALKNIRV